jgi:hypothetical protein
MRPPIFAQRDARKKPGCTRRRVIMQVIARKLRRRRQAVSEAPPALWAQRPERSGTHNRLSLPEKCHALWVATPPVTRSAVAQLVLARARSKSMEHPHTSDIIIGSGEI